MRRLRLLAGLVLLAPLGGGSTAAAAAAPDLGIPSAAPRPTKVVIVTLDGVGSHVVRRLGREGMPSLHRLMDDGASTLTARTARELTTTLPSHTGIVTGRRVDADRGGHGVFWNDERLSPRTVQEAAGHDVASVFSVVDSDQRDPALFTSKPKLSLFERSWPQGVDRFVMKKSNRELVRAARKDLVEDRRALTFLHLSLPDVVGHERGFSSPEFDAAARRVDALLGNVVATIESRPRLREHLTLIVTADHGGGGQPPGHFDPTEPTTFRVPFVVWGVGVSPGSDLYALNDDYRDPGDRRTRYGAIRPPVRNGDAANLATRLLGLGRIPGSEFGFGVRLDVG